MTDYFDWMDYSACRRSDPALFFGPEGETSQAKYQRERQANAICAGCLVRTTCLTYALEQPALHGTWAGRNEEQLAAERRRRGQKRVPASSARSAWCGNRRHLRSRENTRELAGGKTRCKDCEHELYLSKRKAAV